jgi:hypothetical protein
MFDEGAGDAGLFADWPDGVGNVVTDESQKQDDDVDGAVGDSLMDGVELSGSVVEILDPLKLGQFEHALKEFTRFLANGAADHDGIFAGGGGKDVADLFASFDEFATAGVFVVFLFEGTAEGSKFGSADEFAVRSDEVEESRVDGAIAIEDQAERGAELIGVLGARFLLDDKKSEAFEGFVGLAPGLFADLLLADLLFGDAVLVLPGSTDLVTDLRQGLLGLGDVGIPVGGELTIEGFDVSGLVLFRESDETSEDGLEEVAFFFGGVVGLEAAQASDPDFHLGVLFAAIEGAEVGGSILDFTGEGADLEFGEVAGGDLGQFVVVGEAALGGKLEAIEFLAEGLVLIERGANLAPSGFQLLSEGLEFGLGLGAFLLEFSFGLGDEASGLGLPLGPQKGMVLGGVANEFAEQHFFVIDLFELFLAEGSNLAGLDFGEANSFLRFPKGKRSLFGLLADFLVACFRLHVAEQFSELYQGLGSTHGIISP